MEIFKHISYFRPIFFLYCALKILSAIVMIFIDLEFKRPAKKVFTEVWGLMNIELITLCFGAVLLGRD